MKNVIVGNEMHTRGHAASASGAVMGTKVQRRGFVSTVLLAAVVMMGGAAAPNAIAKQSPLKLDVIPTITNISLVNGQLVAAGTASAVLGGKTFTTPFAGVPVNISLAADQTGAGACPILDLALGPINLNLLGLVVETSPICLTVTAYEGGGLLGDLLCAVADLLGGGLSLNQVLGGQGVLTLPGLTAGQLAGLLTGLTDLLNAALDNLLASALATITEVTGPRECAILDLALGPVDLTLLGLNVHLDDCNNGPVTVEITAQRGALLGNLLCALLGNGGINLGDTLAAIINRLLPLL
jgi:hypothetical protein